MDNYDRQLSRWEDGRLEPPYDTRYVKCDYCKEIFERDRSIKRTNEGNSFPIFLYFCGPSCIREWVKENGDD